MHQPSPGVERAAEAAKVWAERLGSPTVRLLHYVLGLLDEEEGRPAVLVERLGLSLPDIRHHLSTLPVGAFPPAPPLATLYAAASAWSVAHRADPAFLTDAFLVAVLEADPAFRLATARLDFDSLRLMALMGDENSPIALTSDPTATFSLPDPTAEHDAARILDANLNRARESLRVLEDYCRFVLDDRYLTEQAKGARHALARVSEHLPPGLLLASRDTLRDVGTTVSAPGEYERESPRNVAAVNLKRLQESLRSLEEYSKPFASSLSREWETIRYQAYTLERAVLPGAAREKVAAARLYVLLTGSQCATSLDWIIEQAAAGGAEVFQLREKALPDRELLERARAVRQWTRRAGVLFIVNDRPDIARLADADGVHLGQDDLPVKEARRILGPAAIIGVSTHTLEQVRAAILDGADYIGVGPTFPSKTKSFESFPGLNFVTAAANETALPAFALGGIGPNNIAQVVAAGGQRIAVSSAVAGADDPQQVARILRAALGE